MFGLAEEWLLHEGRPVADITVLSHPEQLERLRVACPSAVPTAVLGGDPCYDRLLAARSHRDRFRRALGVATGQRLVLLSSTWNPESLFGDGGEDPLPALLPRLTAELPVDEYRIAAVLHPNIWYAHGPGQVRAWCQEATDAGMALIPPLAGWRQALLAADCVIGDHGSVTFYAAALDIPVLMGAFPQHGLDPDSPVAGLGRRAPALRSDEPLLRQVRAVIEKAEPDDYAAVTEQLTSAPGESADRLRRSFYQAIGLAEPADRKALLNPLPLPDCQPPERVRPLTALTRLLGAALGGAPEIDVVRWAGPAPQRGYGAHDTHMVVHEDCPDPGRLSVASVIVRYGHHDDPRFGPAGVWAAETAGRYPQAALTVLVDGPDRCLARTRDGAFMRLIAERRPDGHLDLCDPAAYASALYAWLSNGEPLAALDQGMRVLTGGVPHLVAVTPLPEP